MNILRHFKPKTAFLCLILFALVSIIVLNTVVNDKIGASIHDFLKAVGSISKHFLGFLQESDSSFNEEDLKDPGKIKLYVSIYTKNEVLEQFAPVWTEREMDTTVALLEFFDEVAARKQIDYFIFDSTLWGAINMKRYFKLNISI